MHTHYIELCISEIARTAYSDAFRGPTSGPQSSGSSSIISGSNNNMLSFEHLDFLWRSVRAIKSWMDGFFTLPPFECTGFSFIHTAQMARCLVVLYRLSTYADPAWDCQAVRNTIDLLLVLDRVADKMELISNEAGEHSTNDLYMQLSRTMRRFRANASARMAPKPAATEDIEWLDDGHTADASGDMAAQDQTLLQSMNTADDALLKDIFGGFGVGWTDWL